MFRTPAAVISRLIHAISIGLAALATISCVTTPPPAQPAAQVERIEVTSRKPAFGGTAFGTVGTYELIAAVAHMRIKAGDPRNQRIVDLDKAPAADGWVRYQTDVVILRPQDAKQASRVLLFDIANRGNKLAPVRLNDGASQFETASQAGHGYLMRQGHVMVWAGWQGDVPLGDRGALVGARFPVATEQGQTIVGRSVEEFVFDNTETTSVGTLTYPAASQDNARATLTVRATVASAPVTLPAESWRYVDPAKIEIRRAAGFDGGAIYRFTYDARDPMVMGLGLAAVRDVVDFLRSDGADLQGQKNPLADIAPDVAVAIGISQSGRFLRDFVWMGFNARPGGGKVFDGAMVIIAGSRKSYTNARFAQPGRYSRQHEDHFYPGDQFPFSYAVTTDPVSGATDGIFARCQRDSTCPKTMHLDSSLEFWQARAALVVTDGTGREIALPSDVRAYLMSSAQHGPAATPAAGVCEQLSNPLPQAPTVRALLPQLIAWSRDGKAPPDSRYPRLSDGTLVDPTRAAVGFPDLTAMGVGFPTLVNQLVVVDYAAAPPWPVSDKRYRIFVPRTDADGLDVAGVRLPEAEVPLATHTGWSIRKAGFAPGQLCNINGIYVPFTQTAAERSAKRDPRPSIGERYASREAYAARVEQVARKLAAEGLLLPEDAARYAERARKESRVP